MQPHSRYLGARSTACAHQPELQIAIVATRPELPFLSLPVDVLRASLLESEELRRMVSKSSFPPTVSYPGWAMRLSALSVSLGPGRPFGISFCDLVEPGTKATLWALAGLGGVNASVTCLSGRGALAKASVPLAQCLDHRFPFLRSCDSLAPQGTRRPFELSWCPLRLQWHCAPTKGEQQPPRIEVCSLPVEVQLSATSGIGQCTGSSSFSQAPSTITENTLRPVKRRHGLTLPSGTCGADLGEWPSFE